MLFTDKRQIGVTLAAARYSSEDAAQVVEYIQAVIDFAKKIKPYKKAVQSLKKLKEEMEILENRERERNSAMSQQGPEEV